MKRRVYSTYNAKNVFGMHTCFFFFFFLSDKVFTFFDNNSTFKFFNFFAHGPPILTTTHILTLPLHPIIFFPSPSSFSSHLLLPFLSTHSQRPILQVIKLHQNNSTKTSTHLRMRESLTGLVFSFSLSLSLSLQ